MTDDSSGKEKKKRPSFTTWIVIGLVTGVVWGLFFGDTTNWTKWIGDVYVGLLQMAVLPYISLSLVSNIGRLTIESGKQLLRTGLVVLLGLWVIGLVNLIIMAQAFPHWEAGSFFSSRLIAQPETVDWLDLFVPSNPFRSLVQNSIPAVVVFSIGLGIALIGMRNKSALLDPLDVVVEALGRLNKLVVKLTPLGMFGIVAHTAGTIDMEQFRLIQGYLLTYGASAVLLSFVILPGFVAAVTPFGFLQVLRAARNPLITAFVIGNTFVVLPMMIEAIREMRLGLEDSGPDDEPDPEYLVPLAYPFPDIGRIVGLIFIPFAAWFYGASIDTDQVPALIGTGLVGAFAKPVITVPLLLELAKLPGDIFNLFLASGVIAARFGDLMKTMHLMAFTIVAGCMLAGLARVRVSRLLLTAVVSLASIGGAALAIHWYLQTSFQDTYSREKLITERQLLFPSMRPNSQVEVKVLDTSTAWPSESGLSRVEQIRRRGVLRVGYDPFKMPFAYFRAQAQPTDQQELIGFDMDMARFLADDLHVDLEFVPIKYGMLKTSLDENHFDVIMSAFEGTVRQAELLASSDTYMETILALVVPDHRKKEFQTADQIRNNPDVVLAVIKGSFFAEQAPKTLPSVNLIELDTAEDFFESGYRQADGLVISAEKGAAWTLRYPQFTVTNPAEGKVRVPLYYLSSDAGFNEFLEDWLVLKRTEGTWQDLYDYWILGIEQRPKKPRWCVIRNVLGWVE